LARGRGGLGEGAAPPQAPPCARHAPQGIAPLSLFLPPPLRKEGDKGGGFENPLFNSSPSPSKERGTQGVR